MKKAKRLLAILLAFVMLASAASTTVYAKIYTSENYANPELTGEERWKFSAEQGASYILDFLDEMLAEMGDELYMTDDELGIGSYTGLIKTFAGLDLSVLDLTSVDSIILTIEPLLYKVKEDPGLLVRILNGVNLFGNILDILKYEGINENIRRSTNTDLDVLKMLLTWVLNQRDLIVTLLKGELDAGVFDDMIGDLLNDLLGPGAYDNPTGAVRTLLYGMLVDSNIDTIDEFNALNTTLDAGLQKVVDWALITGTGSIEADGANAAAKGAYSILGENAEPLMPAIADQPGGANITTASLYQMVSNVIQGLLNSMAVPMVSDLLYDALGIELTEQFPYGDPAILTDEMFVLIVGLVEDLCVANGAPKINYTEEENTLPSKKIDKLVDWFFNGGGLDTFILIDYYGIHIQDNFMSLLNDLIRLAINLLPALGLEIDAKPSYTTAQLNEVWYYNEAGEYCRETDEGAINKTYMTYEDGTILVPAELDEKGDPISYNYKSSGLPLDTNTYKQSLVRPNYVITTKMVYASVIKMVLTMFIDGTYFPAWAEDIPSVLAYGLASIGAKVLPANNYFERLDAYYVTGNEDPYTTSTGNVIKPIAYARTTNAGAIKGTASSSQVTIPVGALKIGAEVGAFYLNGILENAGRPFNTTDSSLERFLTEFLLWALDTYIPMLVGHPDATEGSQTYGYFDGNGMWKNKLNTLIALTYGDGGYISNQPLDNADWFAVYDFLDGTLFGLIPASWLPSNLGGSFDFLNRWLLESLCNFDLQSILGLFSVNETGELNETVIVVILRVLDRVLATVFNGMPLLPNTSRTDVYASNTDVRTIHQLVDASSDSAPLCVLITQLFAGLQTYKNDILSVVLPFLLSTSFLKPYDYEGETNYLGTNMTRYSVQDLEDFIKYYTEDVNAFKLGDAYIFDTEEEAEAAVEALKEANIRTDYYIKSVEVEGQTVIVDGEERPVYKYEVWEVKNFMSSATGTPATDAYGDYTSYSAFTYAETIDRTASKVYAKYDDANYIFFEAEDWRNNLYAYNNVNTTIEDAAEYADTYRSYAESALPSAYREWLMFSYKSKLYNLDKWDTNGDGRSVLSDSDSDYVASTESDPGYPVDGEPGAPEKTMYPYVTTDTTNVTFKHHAENKNVTQVRNTFTADNYEQIQFALDYAEIRENWVTLSDEETEIVVRLALNTIAFDITLSDNKYAPGSAQWDTLTEAQITTIRNWCASNDMELVTDEETGKYRIEMKPFKLINESTFSLLNGTVSVTPPAARTDKYTTPNYSQQISNAVYAGYVLYAEELYTNRKNVYNYIDYISDRVESAKTLRPTQYTSIDTTMLKWAMKHVADAYIDPKGNMRNRTVKTVNNGVVELGKVYTEKSYQRFREAYDYANALNLATTGQVAATGLTQSMVSYAFAELMAAYNALVLFTGPADFTQLLNYIAIATEIKEDPNKDDEFLGYTTDSYNALVAELEKAVAVTLDETIDCESQTKVDKAAADLYEKINGLVYNSVPMLNPALDEQGNEIVNTLEISEGARVIGHIFGLKAGEGLGIDLIDVVGMRIEEGVGNKLELTPSGRGNGTGAFIKGTVGNIEKFRYYAVIYGDINGDAMIDGTDRSHIELFELEQTNTEEAMGTVKFEAADINRDGNVDSIDANYIVQYTNYNPDYVIDQDEHSPVATVVSE